NPAGPLGGVPAAGQSGTLAEWLSVTDEIRDGRIRLLMLHDADPVYGLPESLRFQQALADADDLFIVSFTPFLDDTSAMADLILPDRVYLEDWGDDIPEPGPGHQVVGFQQPVVNPLHDLDPRSFPDILLTMAQELGKESELPWANYKQLLREGSDALFALNRGSIRAVSADGFWTQLLQRGGWWDEGQKGPQPVSPPDGLYGRIIAKAAEPQFPGLGLSGDTFYLAPFAHNTLLDGRNAHLPWLQAAPDPLTTITWQTWVEMNDGDARSLDVREGDIMLVESSRESFRALAYLTPAVPPGTVSVPLGGGRRNGSEFATGRPGRESSNVLRILEPSQVEGTGALAWAGTRVRLTRTGESVKVSKFEGIVRAVEIGNSPGERIIQTVTPEQI
ncbi:MAG: molybdopterin dinucleotide binding domain-containing protein, partial [Chloroflexota bacterium]